jgi:uncharacterized protein YbcI
MSESQHVSGGELNAALTREVVRIHTANLGRGPRKSFSFYQGNVVVTVMEESMTKAEQSLAKAGNGDAVIALRRLFHGAMGEELKDSVERLTGRTVTAFMSDSNLEPDLVVEVFILDGQPG